MSEPTYRVDITHDPNRVYAWEAAVIRLSDGNEVHVAASDISREVVVERVQTWVKRQLVSEDPYSVYLSEDGDIIDRHEAGVLRDANA